MKSTQDLIENELLRFCKEGHFEALMLYNNEGIPMVEVNLFEHYNKDGIAALSAVLSQSAELTEEFHANTTVDEVSLRTANKVRIVSRPFQVDNARLILVAIVPKDLPYRKITSAAVQKVQQLL
jgi:predicted regulator of Ras-like GTPase activity (Roadblock/LC7/MglB family)